MPSSWYRCARNRGITVGWFAGLCLADSQLCPGPAALNSWSTTKTKTKLFLGWYFFVSHNQHSGCHSPAHNTTEQIVGCAAAIPLTVCQGYPCPLPPAASAGAWLSWLPLTCLTAWYIWTGIPKCCKLGCSKIFLIEQVKVVHYNLFCELHTCYFKWN